jgi:NADH-quinone oxidoreductase subunit L
MHFASLFDSPLWYAWLIPLFPLIGFLINGVLGPLTGKPLPKAVAGAIGTVAVFASFAVACLLFMHVTSADAAHKISTVYLAPWMNLPTDAQGIHSFTVNFELLIDPLSVLMMLIITGVGGLIHLYSTSYMAADKGYQRFFTYLNLFVFFMLLLVMSNNILGLFIGWEGVGLCSYLLIGYFYEKKSAGDAAKKAFIMNRIGDVGVLIGMFMIFHYFHTLDFVTGYGNGHEVVRGITEAAPMLTQMASGTVIATLLLMLFLGCTGKSAQIPLYTWLPDAMEGPTPVSALIHAATMVTAGIYLVSRTHALFELSDVAMVTMAVIGISTAFFAATIGLMQNDIKRVLAYSTVSQLGYMFAACGSGVFAAGMFHVMTHAFFKACLFLGSGSVIHAVEHAMHTEHDKAGHTDAAHAEHGDSPDEKTGGTAGPDQNDPQDMRNMGGLFPHIKVTAVSMLAATLAISGIIPFAGYWSKDEILWRTWQTMPAGNWLFWGVGVFTALLTAFYMFRMIMKTFFGAPRTEAAKHAHESSLAMIIPIGILAVLSTITGWAVLKFDTFSDFLAPSVSTPGYLNPVHDANMESILGISTLISIVLVIIFCVARYRAASNNELMRPETRANHRVFSPGWYNWAILNKYFVDEAYNFWFVKLGKKLSDWLWLTFEVRGIDGIVNGVGALTAWSGQRIRRTQNGFVRSYAFSMVIGIFVILVFVAVRAAGMVH